MANLRRIEAKLDALLEKQGINPEDVKPTDPPVPEPRKLTPQEQQAIDNAPKVTPAVGPRNPARVNPTTNAPEVDRMVPRSQPNGGLDDLGLTADQEQALRDAGITDRAALAAASDETLIALPGIGRTTVNNLRGKLK